MNYKVMTSDVHSPAFIRMGKQSSQNEKSTMADPSMKEVRRFPWARIIGQIAFVGIIVGVIYLLSKLVTPQVVTVVSVIVGFLVLRFVVKVILQVTFTLLRYIFWIAILCAILLCVL